MYEEESEIYEKHFMSMSSGLQELRLKMADAIDELANDEFKNWSLEKRRELKRRKIENLLQIAKINKERKLKKVKGKERASTFLNLTYQSYEDYVEQNLRRKTMNIESNLSMEKIDEGQEKDLIQIGSDDSFGD